MEHLVSQIVLEPEPAGGSMIVPPVVWQRKTFGKLRLYADYEVQNDCSLLVTDYTLLDIETVFPSLPEGAVRSRKTDLSEVYYQIELEEKAKNFCSIDKKEAFGRLCRLLQGFRYSSVIFQQCM